MKFYKMLGLLIFFLLVASFASANGFDDIFRQLIINKIAKSSPDAGRILQATTRPRLKAKIYVAPNTSISIGQTSYGDYCPKDKMYPEPKTARDYVVYGKMLGNVGKIREAMNYFLIARNMEPDNPEARYGLSMSLAMLGYKRRAKVEFKALQRIQERLEFKIQKLARMIGRN